jgi:membrane fusion protein (multidrug efflux system)
MASEVAPKNFWASADFSINRLIFLRKTAIRTRVAAIFSALLLLTGCDKKQAQQPPPPPQVGVVVVGYQPIARSTDLPGRTTAVMTSEIRPQVSGVILKRLFVEGSDVTSGQQLYQIDPAMYQAGYDSAVATLKHDEAGLATDRDKAARYKPLAAAQAISEQDYDDAVAAVLEDEANIASAKASIEQAEINLEYTKVNAPISGTIGASTVTPGALVTADQTTSLDTITELDPIYVDLNESSTTWLRLKQEADSGQLQTAGDGAPKVSLVLEDGSAYPQSGEMQFSEVNVDQTTGTVLVRAIFPNHNHLLLPGMYVHAELDEGVNKNGILIPQQAVSYNSHGDATVLLVGPDDTVALQVIQVNGDMNNNWIVTGGLKPGDKVIVDGILKAIPGKVVSPIDETASFSNTAAH